VRKQRSCSTSLTPAPEEGDAKGSSGREGQDDSTKATAEQDNGTSTENEGDGKSSANKTKGEPPVLHALLLIFLASSKDNPSPHLHRPNLTTKFGRNVISRKIKSFSVRCSATRIFGGMRRMGIRRERNRTKGIFSSCTCCTCAYTVILK
jgi:hypothetical protein